MGDFDPENGVPGELKEFARRPLREGDWREPPLVLEQFLQARARTGRPGCNAWQDATKMRSLGNLERRGGGAGDWVRYRPQWMLLLRKDKGEYH